MFIRTVTKDTLSQKQSDFNRTHCIIIFIITIDIVIFLWPTGTKPVGTKTFVRRRFAPPTASLATFPYFCRQN